MPQKGKSKKVNDRFLEILLRAAPGYLSRFGVKLQFMTAAYLIDTLFLI